MAREDMRKVELVVMNREVLDGITDTLDAENVDFAVSDHSDGGDAALVVFMVPANAVEPVQDRINSELDDRGIGNDTYTVVSDPEAVVSPRLDVREQHSDIGREGPERISRDELHSTAADMLPDVTIYGILTTIAAVVATSGVLLGSMSVLVGSMVIAPLIGPPMATSVSTVLDDERLFTRAAKLQIVGVGIALLTALVFALFVKQTALVPNAEVAQNLQLNNYAKPTLLLITVAVGSGIAGAISLATSGDVELVGVMMAAALVPPMGVMGVAIAWSQPTAALGSGAVVLVNLLSINLGATISLWYLGYHPRGWTELRSTRSTILRRVLVLIGMIGSLAVVLSSLAGQGGLTRLLGA